MRRASFCITLLLTSTLALGCGDHGDSSSDGGGGSNGAGGQGAMADEWWCTCGNGVSIGVTGESEKCAAICEDSGGLESVEPKVSVVGSAECDAFCATVDALGCPGETCAEGADFWCSVDVGSCPEAKKAMLECQTETGTFECDGDSWQGSSSCSTPDELCE